MGPDGSIYAGSDGEGLIYRVTRDGKATIIFDAPQSEIRTLLWGGDGALYAGHGGRGRRWNLGRSSMFLAQGAGAPSFWTDRPSDREAVISDRRRGGQPGEEAATVQPSGCLRNRRLPGGPPGGGSASPRPITAGDNAVYRLDADGVPREVLRFKALVHALAWVNDRLIVGTGPEGVLFEVREAGHETAPIAKLDSGQILSLLAEPDGTVLLGTGDPGSVVRLSPGYASKGIAGLGDSRHQAGEPVRSVELARRAAGGHCDHVPVALGKRGRAGRDVVGLVGGADRPREGVDRLSGRAIHPVSRQAFDHGPEAHAGAAIGIAQLSGRPTSRRRSPGSTFPT